jgi:hypothetical protein
MQYARKRIGEVAGPKAAERVLFLMDYKANKARYDQQLIAAGEQPLSAPKAPAPPRTNRAPAARPAEMSSDSDEE